MKKLMVAAAAAAMINGAFAAGNAYVYYATLDIRTTQGAYCSEVQSIECGEDGANAYVRKWDDYSISGYIFGCDDSECFHLKNICDVSPAGYGKGANSKGQIFWDTAHKVAIVPSDSTTGMWNSNVTPIWKYSILNVVGPDFDRTESVFAFTGKAKFFSGPDTRTAEQIRAGAPDTRVISYSTFNLTCAGIGVYGVDEQSKMKVTKDGKTVEVDKPIWLRSAGNAAGTLDKVYILNRAEDGTTYTAGTEALGYQCTGKCGEGTARGATAAYGTWTLTYCQALSARYGLVYGQAFNDVVEPYAAW